MNKNIKKTASILITLGVLGAGSIVSAQTLYEETFAPGSAGTLPSVGWIDTGADGYVGTYAYTLTNAATLLPINGQSAVYEGSGTAGAVMGFYTTDALGAGTAPGTSGAFSDIAFTGSLAFGIYNNLQGGGDAGNETAYFLVQDGGNWYASATQITGPTDTDTLMDSQSLTLSPTAANWVTVNGIGTATITYGSTPGSDLGGTITGAGIVFTLNNANYDTENYADFTISAVPEPTTLAFFYGIGLVLMLMPRRTSSDTSKQINNFR